MKHLVAACAAIAILAIAVTEPAKADSAADLAAIQAVYNNQCALALAGDFDSFAKTMTDDYKDIAPNGKIENRDQMVADMKMALQTVKLATCVVAASNPVANADGSVTVNAASTQTGTAPMGSTTTPIVVNGTATDLWVQQGGSWVLKNSTEIESTVTANGQVVQHEGGASPAPSASP